MTGFAICSLLMEDCCNGAPGFASPVIKAVHDGNCWEGSLMSDRL